MRQGIDMVAPLWGFIPDVVDARFCEAFIARMEAVGCVPAPISTAAGFVMRPDIRNNTRVIFDDPELAEALWRRVRALVPPKVHGAVAVGLNERLRCYRYAPGERFAPHYDGAFHRDARESSAYTALIYLNDDFIGGDTALLDLGEVVKPQRGGLLLFQHAQLHEGCVLVEGVKYVLRTDVMYRA